MPRLTATIDDPVPYPIDEIGLTEFLSDLFRRRVIFQDLSMQLVAMLHPEMTIFKVVLGETVLFLAGFCYLTDVREHYPSARLSSLGRARAVLAEMFAQNEKDSLNG